MDIEDINEVMVMQVVAQGTLAILENEGKASCGSGFQAYNLVSSGVGWLNQRLEMLGKRMLEDA